MSGNCVWGHPGKILGSSGLPRGLCGGDIEGGYWDVIGILWTAWTVYVGDIQRGSWDVLGIL